MKPFSKILIRSIIFLAILSLISIRANSQTRMIYDIVISGGRVIDPETKLDSTLNIGIHDHRIAILSTDKLTGKEVVDVTGLVVTPGFIDMHVHGRSNKEQEFQLHDGVTTALELECGIELLAKWYTSKESKSLINYGASVCWPFERFQALPKFQNELSEIQKESTDEAFDVMTLLRLISPSFVSTPTKSELDKTIINIKNSLLDGGLGIGLPIGYLPTVPPSEVFQLFKLSGEMKVPLFIHVRDGGLTAVQQALADAMLTHAPLHIVHINSSTLSDISIALEMVGLANRQGFDITTEIYPYTASSTAIQTALFNDGWQQKMGISYGDLQWAETGERLTKETFDAYRKKGGVVVIHSMKPEWIREGLTTQNVIVASDGMPYSPYAHPRTAGTFSRVLGLYAREEKAIALTEAIKKMTLLPAKRLEAICPQMRRKGRIQVGSDADITVFNPNTIRDKATFENGLAFSIGIEYVIVNGTFALKNGKTVAKVFAGKPLFGKYKVKQ